MLNGNKMNGFEKFVYFLQGTMNKPKPYGVYHICCLILLVAICFLVFKFMKGASDKKIRIFLITISIVLIVLEIIKQLIFSFNYDGVKVNWHYNWGSFPFQFCSVPMYVALIAGILKDGKVRDALYAFLGTYTLFAGMAVMIYPATVFMDYIAINIHTVVHHGAMVVIAVGMLSSGRCKTENKTILKALPVFLTLTTVAFFANIIFYKSGNTEYFNLFYISPYYRSEIPFLDYFRKVYPIMLILYIGVFTLISFIIIILVRLMKNAYLNSRESKKQTP